MNPLSSYGAYEFIPYLSPCPQAETRPNNSTITTPPNEPPLKVHNTSSWTYCGPILAPDPTALPSSLQTWTTTTISCPSTFFSRLSPLLAFLRVFLSEAGVTHYWLTVRATQPTPDYNTPRWHVDDDFFASLNSPDKDAAHPTKNPGRKQHNRWKLCTTLLGPGTLFLASPSALPTLRLVKAQQQNSHPHTCVSIRCLGCASTSDAVRRILADKFSHHQTHSPAYGHLSFFRIGDDKGAVHSEPKCDVDRIFINVVPGTEADLQALMKRWGMGFPRAWCYGVPVGFVRSDEFNELDGARR